MSCADTIWPYPLSDGQHRHSLPCLLFRNVQSFHRFYSVCGYTTSGTDPVSAAASAPARRPLSPRGLTPPQPFLILRHVCNLPKLNVVSGTDADPAGNRPITSFSRDGPRLPSPEPETQAVPLCVPMPNLHALLESVRESCVVVRGQPGSLLGTSRIRPELKASDQAFVAAGPVRVAVADETELENRGVLERSGRAMDRDDRVKSMLMIEGGERNVDEISWLVKMLSDVVPLSNLPPRMLQEVCKTMKVHDYPAGMAVYTSGDSANSLFVVLSGSAKSWIIPGQEVVFLSSCRAFGTLRLALTFGLPLPDGKSQRPRRSPSECGSDWITK